MKPGQSLLQSTIILYDNMCVCMFICIDTCMCVFTYVHAHGATYNFCIRSYLDCIVECKDKVIILPDDAGSHKYFRTVEGRSVSFTYHCTGSAFNQWGVDGYDISNNPFYNYNFEESNSSLGCVNNFTLTLHDVTLHYSKAYTAYPSISKHFNKNGVNTTFYLSK